MLQIRKAKDISAPLRIEISMEAVLWRCKGFPLNVYIIRRHDVTVMRTLAHLSLSLKAHGYSSHVVFVFHIKPAD
jgi:hypothetical protein